MRGDNESKLTPEERTDIEKRFKEMDFDGSGFVTKSEARKYLKKKLEGFMSIKEEALKRAIKLQPQKKAQLENELKYIGEITRRGLAYEIQHLFEKDSNADGKV
jgi:Ca2+-binding EF-hand superfamily protein